MAEKKRIDWKSLGLVKGKDGLVTFNGLNPMDVLPENSIAYATSYGVYAMMTRATARSKDDTMTAEEMKSAIGEIWDWLVAGCPDDSPEAKKAKRIKSIETAVTEGKAKITDLETALSAMKDKTGKEILTKLIDGTKAEVAKLEESLKALKA